MDKQKPLGKRIIRLLDANPEIEYNAKELSGLLKENVNTVRSTLARLKKQGKIKSEQRGFYRSVKSIVLSNKAIVKELEIHGFKMEYHEKKIKSKTGSFLHAPLSPLRHRHKINHSIIDYGSFISNGKTYDVTITLHENSLELWVKCSLNPMKIEDFFAFWGWVQGVFPALRNKQRWKVIQSGVNVDYKGLRIDGTNSMTLVEYENALVRIYNKEKEGRGLRTEVHVSSKKESALSLTEAFDLMRSGGVPAQKIEELIKKMEETTEKMGEITDIKNDIKELKEATESLIKAMTVQMNYMAQQQSAPSSPQIKSPEAQGNNDPMFL